MSLSPSAQRAVEWLEQQVTDLTGIRNATPRDPSFKNWRQSCLTTLQRVWPGDQERSERFRRIPFSPVDPRADARTVREWYSRGCQEAARVLNGFVEDVRQNGVPEQPSEILTTAVGADFTDDFPTVDLPAGNLSNVAKEPVAESNMLSEFVDDVPRVNAANAPAPPSLPSEIPAIHNPVAEVHAHDTRQTRKGVGARLKDLLGFAQLSAKALAGFPRETPPSGLPSLDAPVNSSRPSMDVEPLGGAVQSERRRVPQSRLTRLGAPAAREVAPAPKAENALPSAPPELSVSVPQNQPPPAGAPTSGSGSWPLPKPHDRDKTEAVTPPAATPPAPATPLSSAPPAPRVPEAGMSVVMSRPTTLRAAIEKVSIESLLSDQFRTPAPEPSPPAAVTPVAVPPAAVPPPTVPLAVQEGSTQALEDMVNAMLTSAAETLPAQPLEPAATSPVEAPVVVPPSQAPAAVEPARPDAFAGATPPAPIPVAGDMTTDSEELGLPEIEAIEAELDPPPAPRSATPAPFIQLPPRNRQPNGQESETERNSAVGKVDPDAFARATEDFMRSSPVLGATGRKVSRPEEDTGFNDPDAIAVASMVQELGRLDVPAGRHAEVRARLLDLARRIEKGELEWTSLRKAVWFAMEYPEIARRLMPVLLPWIDRAA
jgi:hypothetical protein